MVRIVPVYKRLVCGTVVFDHDCVVGRLVPAASQEPKRLFSPKRREKKADDGNDLHFEVDLPSRFARQLFQATGPVERRSRSWRMPRSWKDFRSEQFHPQQI